MHDGRHDTSVIMKPRITIHSSTDTAADMTTSDNLSTKRVSTRQPTLDGATSTIIITADAARESERVGQASEGRILLWR